MNPPSPVCLTTEAVDISMKATDYFFFHLEVDGVFASPHAKEFQPHLPHDRSFKAGSVWPNPKEHPEGAKPCANGTYNYTWTPDASKPKPPTEKPGSIHVSTGMDHSLV
jgi:hypothetical protein